MITNVRDLARVHTKAAVETLERIMADPKAPHSARAAAAATLLDRGHGKAVQVVETEISVYDSLGLLEQQALLAELDFVADEEATEVELIPVRFGSFPAVTAQVE